MTVLKYFCLTLTACFLAGCIPATHPVDQHASVHTNVPNLVDNDSSTPLVPQQEW